MDWAAVACALDALRAAESALRLVLTQASYCQWHSQWDPMPPFEAAWWPSNRTRRRREQRRRAKLSKKRPSRRWVPVQPQAGAAGPRDVEMTVASSDSLVVADSRQWETALVEIGEAVRIPAPAATQTPNNAAEPQAKRPRSSSAKKRADVAAARDAAGAEASTWAPPRRQRSRSVASVASIL